MGEEKELKGGFSIPEGVVQLTSKQLIEYSKKLAEASKGKTQQEIDMEIAMVTKG